MGRLSGKVAVVTGASRGVGRGIALSLGAEGATVYITGRTVDEKQATVPLTGTVQTTADEVTQAGGKGIAIRCDHRDDEQVKAAFKQVMDEQGFGNCTNTYECEAVCPAKISASFIAKLNREYARAQFRQRLGE